MNVGNQAESKPFTFIFGVGISEYIGSMDSDAGRFKGATAEGRAVPDAVHRSHSDHFPAKQGERAMPMLFWLPMIFASAWWEMNGFPPQTLANNNPAPA
jgi:hypothetical protein